MSILHGIKKIAIGLNLDIDLDLNLKLESGVIN